MGSVLNTYRGLMDGVREAKIEVRRAMAEVESREEQLVLAIIDNKDISLLQPCYTRLNMILRRNG